MSVTSKYTKIDPVQLRRLTPTELAWVAGLLEGEGCFTRKSRASSPRGIVVMCQMTDCDVLHRLHKIVGAGYFRGPYPNGPRGRLPRYTFQVSGNLAYQLMKQLLPLMCSRRTARIRQLLREYESVRDHVYKLQHVESGRVETTTDIGKWLTKHGMSPNGLYQTLHGRRAACRGWKRLA
jgi:hypothetical protein